MTIPTVFHAIILACSLHADMGVPECKVFANPRAVELTPEGCQRDLDDAIKVFRQDFDTRRDLEDGNIELRGICHAASPTWNPVDHASALLKLYKGGLMDHDWLRTFRDENRSDAKDER